MNKFRKIILISLMLSITFTTAFALDVNNGSGYDFDSKTFTVYGKTEYPNQPVKLEILKRDVGFAAFDSKDDLLYIIQDYSDEDKNLYFEIEVSEIGAFSYRVSELDGKLVHVSSFATYTEETVNSAIDTYIKNKERTSDELLLIISNYYPSFDIEIGEFTDLEEKTSPLLDKINSTPYDDVDIFKKDVSKLVAVEIIQSKGDVEDKALYMERYAKQLGVSEDEWFLTFKDMDIDEKKLISPMVSDGDPYGDFVLNFENAFILYMIKNSLWNNVATTMDLYLDCGAVDLLEDTSETNAKEAVEALIKGINEGEVIKAKDMYDYLKDNIVQDDDEEEDDEKVTSTKGGRGSFTAPSVPLATEPVVTPQVNENQGYFLDISDVAWAKDAIDYLYKKGVINGKAQNVFAPNDSVTREEFVKMVMLAFKLDTSNGASFTDADANAWYYPYVSGAYSLGIVNGKADGSFGVGEQIKRQDMVVILYNALVKTGFAPASAQETEFADKGEISEYAKTAVAALSSMNCLSGDASGNVMPQKNSSRAEAAKLIYSVVTTVNK